MNDVKKQRRNRIAGLAYFYFNILLAIGGLFLIGANIYGEVARGNSSGGGLFAGIVITIYSGIAIIKYNPYKTKETDSANPESDLEQS